jgi:hypothetical protein
MLRPCRRREGSVASTAPSRQKAAAQIPGSSTAAALPKIQAVCPRDDLLRIPLDFAALQEKRAVNVNPPHLSQTFFPIALPMQNSCAGTVLARFLLKQGQAGVHTGIRQRSDQNHEKDRSDHQAVQA